MKQAMLCYSIKFPDLANNDEYKFIGRLLQHLEDGNSQNFTYDTTDHETLAKGDARISQLLSRIHSNFERKTASLNETQKEPDSDSGLMVEGRIE